MALLSPPEIWGGAGSRRLPAGGHLSVVLQFGPASVPLPPVNMRMGSTQPSPSGQDEGPRRVAGLQAAQELPGFLLHEELVPGPPTGHRLPGAGHLGGGKKVTMQEGAACSQRTMAEASLVGGVGIISITLPLEASLLVLAPTSGWPWGSHSCLWAQRPDH